jgi:DNA polymerase-3 subunit gamma/tau
LLGAVLKGDAKTALENFRHQYDAGAEPAVILRDMLDLVHLLTRIKAAGSEAAAHGPAGEADAERARTMADNLELNALTRAWSLLMKGLAETQIAPDPAAAGDMALIRMCFAANLPTPDEALRALKKNTSAGSNQRETVSASPRNEPAPAAQEKTAPAKAEAPLKAQIVDIAPPLSQRPPEGPWLRSFSDLINLAGEKRDAKFRTELESYVHIISFAQGRIELRLHDDAPTDLANRLTLRLKEWTRQQWLVSVNANAAGAKTVRDARTAEVMAHPLVQKALEIFPGAEITAIRDPERPPQSAPSFEDDEDAPVDPDTPFDEMMRDQNSSKV